MTDPTPDDAVLSDARALAIDKAARLLLWFQNHKHAEVSDAKEAWEALADALDTPATPPASDAPASLDSLATAKARLSIAAVKARNSGSAKVEVIADDVAVLLVAHSDQDRALSVSDTREIGAGEVLGPLWRKVQQVQSDAMRHDWSVEDYRAGMAATLGIAAAPKFASDTYSAEVEALYTRWLAGDETLLLTRVQHLRFQARIDRETRERAR